MGVSILAFYTIAKVIIRTETTKKCILIKIFVISLLAIRQNWICYVIRTGRLGLSIKKGLSKLRYLNLASWCLVILEGQATVLLKRARVS